MSQTMVMSSGQRQMGVPQAVAAAGPSRLERWGVVESDSTPKIVQITPQMLQTMSPQEIARIAMSNIAIWGGQENDFFTKLLPANHMLRKPKKFDPQILQKAPYLGSCKIGEVLVEKKNDGSMVTQQMFMANFIADIDTSGKGDLFNLQSKDIGNGPKMFYSLNLVLDPSGKPIGFDRGKGKGGVSFQTLNKADAAWHIAAAATGMTVEELKERQRKR